MAEDSKTSPTTPARKLTMAEQLVNYISPGLSKGYETVTNIVKGIDSKMLTINSSMPLNTLTPKKSFNVVQDFNWNFTNVNLRQQLEENIPYIELIEYEQDIASLYASLNYWLENIQSANTSDTSPYKGLYHAQRTGTLFRFPYYEEYDHNINQTWEENKGIFENEIAELLLNLTKNAALFFKMAPGTAVNKPRVWSGVGCAEYTVNFTLFNTFDEGDIARNKELRYRLQMSTLHNQMGPILASPPAIFTVSIPGIRYSPAAVIRQLAITNVGQMNLINGENIPDAYQFAINIAELIPESRQIFGAAMSKSFDKVTAITEEKVDPVTLVQKGVKGGATTLENLINSAKEQITQI